MLLCAVFIAKLCLTATAWTVACQAPLSMEFSRQEYWSGLPFPPPEDLPDPGIEPVSPALAGGFFTAKPQGKTTRPFVTLSHIDSYPNLVTKISVLFPLFVSHFCPPYIRSPLSRKAIQ